MHKNTKICTFIDYKLSYCDWLLNWIPFYFFICFCLILAPQSVPKQKKQIKQSKLQATHTQTQSEKKKKATRDIEYCKIQWWRETHYETKRGGCEWRAEQCWRTLASLRWHTCMPSCRIYPGALGLCSEKTQMAWGVLQLAAVGVPLSGPLERGKGWMNGGKTRGIRRGGHRESSKWFQGAGPTCRKKDEWAGGCCCALRGPGRDPPTGSLLHTVLKVLPDILLLSWQLISMFKATASSPKRKKYGWWCHLHWVCLRKLSLGIRDVFEVGTMTMCFKARFKRELWQSDTLCCFFLDL